MGTHEILTKDPFFFLALENGRPFSVLKLLFYGRFKMASKNLFSNKTRLKTWIFLAFRNECFLDVKKRLFYGHYGMLKKSALYNNSNFLLFFIHYETVKRSYFVTASRYAGANPWWKKNLKPCDPSECLVLSNSYSFRPKRKKSIE